MSGIFLNPQAPETFPERFELLLGAFLGDVLLDIAWIYTEQCRWMKVLCFLDFISALQEPRLYKVAEVLVLK